ncbi:maleate cis-trans isomerase [Verticiella sediminum]|uniref:Maleate cis-trans isomerase n=1 Tax=Verticiella sediminum TaxID=1247510 RepID=A0A556AIL9_9BURK|nr:maleate cis-trans isomerase [Verticiella sediminum]TSH92738.1 maleate cis-trans isomerase [Verticiella sediminum]
MTDMLRTRRLGLLLPSSNSTQEPEFSDVLPRDVSLHTARLTLNSIDAESTVRIVEELETESRKLADADVGVILLAATAPTSRKGLGYDKELLGRIQDATGKPAATASTAMLEAFAVLNIQRVALAAPWSESVNQTVASFIQANGVQVVSQRAMGVVRNNDVGRLSPDTAFALACEADRSEADAVFLACGNWWAMSRVEALERKLGKPVLTTNQVSIWAALRLLGQSTPLSGWGSLLSGMAEKG